MPKDRPIKRGALGRGLALSIASARASGAFAFDGAWRKLGGRGDDLRLAREAQRFAKTLGELKGSYVKIGQMFALLGEHFLPAPLTRALHDLESDAQPLEWCHVRPVMENVLGDRLSELDIDPQALAAASLAQVHRATLRASNTPVVVKIQYPTVVEVLEDDFNAVVRLLTLSRWIPASREFDGWLALLREQLVAEVDYPRERRMAEQVAKAVNRWRLSNAIDAPVLVPHYHSELCAEGVLVMDYMAGARLTPILVQQLPQPTRNALGKTMLQLFFLEVFDCGLMQADPNFGNYLIDPESGSLVLLDFGSVIELGRELRQALADTMIAGLEDHDDRLVDALERLGCLRPDSSDYARDTFRNFIRHLLEPLRPPEKLPASYLNADGQYCWAMSGLLARAGKKAASSAASRHFNIPNAEFALIARKLTGVFTFIAMLEAEFNAWDVVAPFVEQREVVA